MNKLGSMDLMKSKCGCETDACGCEETAEEAKPAPAIADCGCKSGACDTGCRGARVGILDRVTACKDNSCASDCETRAVLELLPCLGHESTSEQRTASKAGTGAY